MLAWLRSLWNRTPAPPAPATTAAARRAQAAAAALAIQARYENSLFTDENQRAWSQVDWMSAKSSNNFHVRRQLRIRSRYELSNNPYLYGICTSNADDLINTGPTLKCLRSNRGENRQIEYAWQSWANAVDLVEKLRTSKIAKNVDGEAFLVLRTVEDLPHAVKLYPCDLEADQITTPMPKNLQELWVDGLILHPVTGRPIAYTVLRHHPGDYFFPDLNPLEYDRIPARFVLQWFCKFRPGQVRGVPVFTPALDLFAELRAFRKAVLNKATTAANLTAVLETEGPAGVDDNGNPIQPDPWDAVQIDRGAMTTLPGGTKLSQFQATEPSTTYEQFSEKCLGEACRPLSYPLNLALGTSQKFNFSSARLDHINYRNALDVERAECNRVVLDPMFCAFIEEAVMVPSLLPESINSVEDIPHEWHWPGYQPLDPVQDATADHARISNGTLTWQQFWASRGYDWRRVMAQQAEELQEIERLGLVFGDPLKKSESETTTEETGPGQQPTAAMHAAFDEQQPREDDGKFAPEGGGETHARREQEDSAREQRRSEEEDRLSERQSREDRHVEHHREREDRQVEQQRDREDSRTRDKRYREDDRREAKKERERDRAYEAHGEEPDLNDPAHKEWEEKVDRDLAEIDRRHAQEDRQRDEERKQKHEQEDAATQARRDQEDAGRAARRAQEDAERENRHAAERDSMRQRWDEEEEAIERLREAEDRRASRSSRRHRLTAHIVKLPSGKYRLYSKQKGADGKRKNLGTYATLEEAKQREREVDYYKQRSGKEAALVP